MLNRRRAHVRVVAACVALACSSLQAQSGRAEPMKALFSDDGGPVWNSAVAAYEQGQPALVLSTLKGMPPQESKAARDLIEELRLEASKMAQQRLPRKTFNKARRATSHQRYEAEVN